MILRPSTLLTIMVTQGMYLMELLAISCTEVRDLSQHFPALHSPYPTPRKLCVPTLLLGPHKEATKLLGCYPTCPRSTEWVEDEIPLLAGGEDGAAHQTQRLLGGMVSVTCLPPGHGRDTPDGGDLCCWIYAVYEVVVEGVVGAISFSRPNDGLVGVGPRKLDKGPAWRFAKQSCQMGKGRALGWRSRSRHAKGIAAASTRSAS